MTAASALPNRPERLADVAAGSPLDPLDVFAPRHIGPSEAQITRMLETLGLDSLDALTWQTVPASIRLKQPMTLPGLEGVRGESGLLAHLRQIAEQNQVFRSYIGMGYHDCITPAVILRNVLENPLWYTPYTPYQAEIAQGRLEALLNFQTMVSDLTGLPLANASLLDEGTAAAEAMTMCVAIKGSDKPYLVSADCHPQTIAVVRTRAESMGIEVRLVDADGLQAADIEGACGVLVQYPTTDGRVVDYSGLCEAAHAAGAMVVAAVDLLALALLKPPGEWGADIAVGSAQRLGVPMGYGGPHAAFLATTQAYARKMPGRIVGVARDAAGDPAYRLAIQTREQHIRRDKATSNICTAQALLAVMAAMYAVYHGPTGLVRIARRIHTLAATLAAALRQLGHDCGRQPFFDTLKVRLGGALDARTVLEAARQRGINLRRYDDGAIGLAMDETVTRQDLADLVACFGGDPQAIDLDDLAARVATDLPEPFARRSAYLTHPVFHQHHGEHEMLRYLTRLQSRDVSLAHSMISLGSCTMKLNAASEMIPVTWPQFAKLHPFVPAEQARGYQRLIGELETWLAAITGFDAVSLQPNAGSQGEFAGLVAIRRYHASRTEAGAAPRDVCLIPVSAHGTNPASAVTAGLRVVPVACDDQGNIDLADLRARAAEHADRLACLMVTYPSTHGVFEEGIRDICQIVHEHGGQVYMDGANMNAQVGLCSPGDIGADVCHLNLHKTFCIPHGGGGPGVGPVAAKAHLAPFLPRCMNGAGSDDVRIAAAPFGSASILPIPWVYIALMGAAGLRQATQAAILNANYMARRLEDHYDVLYRGGNGRVAHEFILDCRGFEKSAGVRVEDIAKRLMDFGFHAPTMSWPVPGTLMIEPTESESLAELDRFCEAMIAIRQEIRDIEQGQLHPEDNPLRNAPHTAVMICGQEWPHPYSREQAAFPLPWLREPGRKLWPAVRRIDNAYGDRHLVCTCPPMSEM